MFVVEPDRQEDVATALAGIRFVQPAFDTAGSKITYVELSHVG
tara:strand:- start:141 stop:269 length:129 start_codon:yes stop_codon:yes gene_type:complete